jgi:hypothetical protein
MIEKEFNDAMIFILFYIVYVIFYLTFVNFEHNNKL